MEPVKFLVDSMAGKLARWLRMLGFDAEYERSGDPELLIRRAVSEDRVILTRNLKFRKIRVPRSVKVFFLSSEKTNLQVREVVEKFGLVHHIRPFTRCIECNVELEKVKNKEDIKLKVPYFVYITHDEFSICPKCHRIYWKGTHTKAMIDRIELVLGEELAKKIRHF